jgi:hypothetical protein
MSDHADSQHDLRRICRRAFLRLASITPTAMAAYSAFAADPLYLSSEAQANGQTKDTYETQAKGIRILPGQWRPHYPWEQIVWISPSWPSQNYLWLDFPEAIFSNQGLLYLSHINPPIRTAFPEWPKVSWHQIPNGLAFDRLLPNGVRFGGRVTKKSNTVVGLELKVHNGSSRSLTDITLQTCAFLRAIPEFAEFTTDNKFVHVASAGFIPLSKALTLKEGIGPYRLGWRTKGKLLADLPVIITMSNQVERLVAMTWRRDTLSLVSNPNHPCMHADPKIRDLEPAEEASIYGELIFFEGKLADFDCKKHLDG